MIINSRIKRTAALLASIVLLSSLCGCHEREIEPVPDDDKANEVTISFSWWGSDELNKSTLNGLSQFTEDTGITVIPQYGDLDSVKSKLDMQIYSGTEPDVIQLSYDWLYQYASDKQAFLSLDNRSEIEQAPYPEEKLSCGKIDDELIAVPYGLDALSFVYNKTLYDYYNETYFKEKNKKLPSRWDELYEYADVMRHDLVYPIAMTDKHFWFASCAYMEQTTGHTVFDDDGQLALTKSDIEIMLNFTKELLENKVCPPPAEYDRHEFSTLRYAGVTCFSPDLGYFEDAAHEMNMQLITGQYPTEIYYKRYGWYTKPTGLYAISSNSKHAHEASVLLNYMVNSSEMAVNFGMSKGFPISRAAQETLEAKRMLKGIEYEASKRYINNAQLASMNPHMDSDELVKIFTDAINAVYYNLETTTRPVEMENPLEVDRIRAQNRQLISQVAAEVYDEFSKIEY